MLEYGITWSGRKHVVGHRTKLGASMAACNAGTELYTLTEIETYDERQYISERVRDAWGNAPLCKRCAKKIGAAS